MLAEMKQSPLKVFWGAPFKTPYTIPQSTVAYNFTKETHQEVQKWPECFGVWETVREFLQEEDEDTQANKKTENKANKTKPHHQEDEDDD